MELIRAIPPAAAAPVRKIGGRVQKSGNMHFMAVCVTVTPTTKSQRELMPGIANQPDANKAIIDHPSAAANAEQATCQRRSPVRSECLPTRIIPARAIKLGAAARRPISDFSQVGNWLFRNVGR